MAAETLCGATAIVVKKARNLQADAFSYEFLDEPGLDAEKAGQALVEGFEMEFTATCPIK